MNTAATKMTNECDTNISGTNELNYMNSKKFNIQFSVDNVGLSVFSLNISSLNKHKEELLCFLSTLDLKFDIIILSETRKKHSDLFHSFFPEYRILSDLPENSDFGGIAIYINKNIIFKQRNDLKIPIPGTESVFVEILLNNQKTIIGGIYKHPYVALSLFENAMVDLVQKLNHENLIMLGDFNVDLLNKNKCVKTRNYHDLMKTMKLSQIIKEPTRITNHSKTLIDHVYIKPVSHMNYSSGVFRHPISDHLATYLIIHKKGQITLKDRPMTRILSEKNIALFKKEIQNLNRNIFDGKSKSANELWSYFIKEVIVAYEKSFPLVKVSRQKFKDKEWITSGLKKSCHVKEKLYKIYIKSKSPLDIRLDIYLFFAAFIKLFSWFL